MIKAIELERPALCFFLGDGERDFDALLDRYPALPFYAVRGNCDFRSQASSSVICNIMGVSIFATHGHMYNVKYEPSLDTLTARAVEAGADVALFGHTHQQYMSYQMGVLVINPGSIGRGTYPCYAVLEIDKGNCSADLRTL